MFERVDTIAGASAEARLRDKLRKIEALFAGAGTPGEKAAADAAADRIRARLGTATGSEVPEEIRFSVPDSWSRQLFIALCLWPEFRELSGALSAYLAEITVRRCMPKSGRNRDG